MIAYDMRHEDDDAAIFSLSIFCSLLFSNHTYIEIINGMLTPSNQKPANIVNTLIIYNKLSVNKGRSTVIKSTVI